MSADALPPLPVPKPENQKRGRKSRAKGKAFEDLLDKTFAYYTEKGFAQIEKTPEPMKVIRSMGQGRFLACYTKGAQPDYKGTIKGGRSVMFEAKYTDKDRIDQDRVNEDQAAYLTQAEELGARCFILAGFQDGGIYRIPWGVWKNMKRIFGRKYVTEKDLQQYRISRSWNDMLMLIN